MPSDLAHFRRLTMGKPVIMGRTTFQSIGKPLAGRDNIVLSRDPAFRCDGVTVVRSLSEALAAATVAAAARGVDEIMVIGGAEVYRAALALADRVYLNRIHAEPEGDAIFPALAPAEWTETSRSPLPRGPNDQFDAEAIVYDRRHPSAA
jgi:dihydrofolate reductase